MLEQLKERHLGHLCSLFKRERITSAVLPIFTDADLQKLGVKRQCGRRVCDVRHAGPGGIEAVTSVGCGVVPGNRRGCVGRQLQATEETLSFCFRWDSVQRREDEGIHRTSLIPSAMKDSHCMWCHVDGSALDSTRSRTVWKTTHVWIHGLKSDICLTLNGHTLNKL